MKQEKSCGAIVIHHFSGVIKVLLIRHVNGGHWSFPKGHVENSESETETALREIKEETGLEVKLDTGFRHVTTYSPKENVIKDVVYFTAQAAEDRVILQKEEVLESGWFPFDKAKQMITYVNDKKILEAAEKYLNETK